MLRDKLRGTGVALVTPFTSDHKVDFPALEKVIEHVIRNGVEYLVTLGTTGEAPTLSRAEKKDIITFTYEKVDGAVPIVVGIGGNNTRELIDDLETFPLEKAIAILSASPYYSKPSQEGLFQHYKSLAAATTKPILLYNVPGRTGRNLTAETTLRLATEVDNIAGIKEAAGDMVQAMNILRDKPADFLVVSGDDALALPQIACGMDGVISVAANALPKAFSEMVRHCLIGEFRIAKGLNDKLIESYELMFAENNPAGVKAAMEILGLIESHLRLPLVPISRDLYSRMKKFLGQLLG
ncbi:MAG: 4-hydroxy-tetrahydrodipicolinate synthase [Chitinophagaceae bacterium]|nr:4-hydroxy-tetrahydrodipicolinate synthase [Chitinophagaceae bacterium]